MHHTDAQDNIGDRLRVNKRRLTFISAFLCSTFLASAAFAQTQTSVNETARVNEAIKKPTDQKGDMLSPVVLISAPISAPLTIVMDPKSPRQPIPASDGADYLKTIPGFATIRNGGTNGDPVFRGMFGSRLNIVTDGSVILGACPNRMDNPTSYISPENYDKMTIVKGPETVRWGATGSAATILFEREPQHYDKLTVKGDTSLVFGTNERFDTRIDGTIGDKLGYVRVIGNKSFAHDYHDGDGNVIPSNWDKWNGDLFLGWTPDSDTLFEVSGGGGNGEARYAGRGMDGTQFKRESLGAKFIKTNISDVLTKIDAQVYYNYADHIMDNFRMRTPGSGSMGDMHGMGHMAGMTHGGMSSMGQNSMHAGMNMNHGDMSHGDMDHGGGGMNMSTPMESRLDRRTIGGRVAATLEWSDISLVTGIDVQSNTHRKRKSKDMMSIEGWDKDAVFYNYGAFGEVTWSFAEDQRIVGGARIDWVSVDDKRQSSETFNDQRDSVLPSAFLRYERDLEIMPITTYVGIGHAERFPDYWEIFSPKEADSQYANAFEGLKPEKTTQLDFGAQFSNGDTNIWASGYVGRIQDYILFDYSGDKSKATNVDATIMGGEAGVSQYFFTSWRLDTSIAYSWGKNTTDNAALPQIPPFEGRIGLTYEQEKWSVGGLWRLVAEQTRIAKDMGNVVGRDFAKSSAFAVFSLNASYKVTDAFRITGGIDNLFNKEYSEHLNRDGDAGFGFPAHYQLREPGRTFWAKVDFKF